MNLQSLRNPDLYHGRKGRTYFEGWYFKLVDASLQQALAFIPGIFYTSEPHACHAFIQIVDGTAKTYRYQRFGTDRFSADPARFSLNIAGSSWGREGLSLNIGANQAGKHEADRKADKSSIPQNMASTQNESDPKHEAGAKEIKSAQGGSDIFGMITGDVSFSRHTDWPDTFLNPGSMGFYNYIPRMQCYSQVCSMDFELDGFITIGDVKSSGAGQGTDNSIHSAPRVIDFSGGRGYIEKNWGSAFPYSWVWVQCNHFSRSRASLSCSLGHIPFLFTSFRGFLAGLSVEEQFYRFTTMNRTKAEVLQTGTDVVLRLVNKNHTLSIDVETEKDDFILLNGPQARAGDMVPLVQENLNGRVRVKLQETSTGRIIFEDSGRRAGVEYGGDQMLVLD